MSQRTPTVEISPKTIVFTVLFLLFLWVLWIVRDLIFSFIIAFILMSALNPLVSYVERYKIPRAFSALIIFASLIAFLGYLFSWILPPIVIETSALITTFPKNLTHVTLYGVPIDVSMLTRYVPDVTGYVFGFARDTVSNTVFVITTVFFGYYFLLDGDMMQKFLDRFIPQEDTQRIINLFAKAEVRMRYWLWGEIILMVTIGLSTYIGLLLVGARYALPMAVLAGLLEIIPIVGPIISAIPAIVINGIYSMLGGVTVTAVYFIVQQLENQIIVPIVMKRAVGLNPIITLAALIIGGSLGGIMGMLLSIPVTLFLETLLIEMTESRRRTAKGHAENKR